MWVASAVIRTDSPFAGCPARGVSAFEPDGRNNKRHRLRSQHAKLGWLREKLLMESAAKLGRRFIGLIPSCRSLAPGEASASPFPVSRTSALTRYVEASSIAIDVSASQFPQLPMPRHSPEQVGGYRATNAWLERYPLRQHKDLQESAQDRLSGGQKNYSTVSRDPRHRL